MSESFSKSLLAKGLLYPRTCKQRGLGPCNQKPKVSDPCEFKFSKDQVDLFRQWFNAVEDVAPSYLDTRDHALAKLVYDMLGRHKPKAKACSARLNMNNFRG